jgi:transcriptional regulator with XRE-family HTH domain
MSLDDGANWSVVTGDNFRDRRIHLNLTQAEVAEEAGLKSYETVGAVERGEGSPTSRRRIDQALSRLEAEVGAHAQAAEPEAAKPDPGASPIRLTFHDVFGIGEIIAEGPADKPDELIAAVTKLMAELRERGEK